MFEFNAIVRSYRRVTLPREFETGDVVTLKVELVKKARGN